jgi:two-component system sensor histidine kinase SenX3
MRISGRRRRTVGFVVLGACLVALAAAFNVGWIVLTGRGVLLVLGILLFPLIVAGLVLNTIFLVREIRRNEQHNAFINAVTHELKTPIASIRLYLETLQSHPVDAAKQHEFYRIMLADSDRLLHTLEQVLRTGRLGQSRRRQGREAVDLTALADESAGLITARYGLAPEAIARHFCTSGASAVVMGDRDELRAAISNLLDNAIKYTAPASQGPRVELDLAREDAATWTLRVRDSGIGIAGSELKAIFRRFHRGTQYLPQVTGTGLGLFIVRSVIRRHGGRVYAESAGPGKGSTFVVQLPAAPSPNINVGARA